MSVTIDSNVPQDLPDRIGPEMAPKRSFSEHIQHISRAFTTKQGLIGTYDYGVYPLGNFDAGDILSLPG
jgi:NCS2 family nucleobase:cation symporter-2